MPDWQLTNVADAAPECDVVRRWLREFNLVANPTFMQRIAEPEHDARPLVLVAKQGGAVVGGLLAETRFTWLKISILAVAPEHRNRGLGAALLTEAERQAHDRGCTHAYVDTMDYQAPAFYTKQGYKTVGRLDDWDSLGHAKLFLTKRLTTSFSSTDFT